jgi:hypothetical protein
VAAASKRKRKQASSENEKKKIANAVARKHGSGKKRNGNISIMAAAASAPGKTAAYKHRSGHQAAAGSENQAKIGRRRGNGVAAAEKPKPGENSASAK